MYGCQVFALICGHYIKSATCTDFGAHSVTPHFGHFWPFIHGLSV